MAATATLETLFPAQPLRRLPSPGEIARLAQLWLGWSVPSGGVSRRRLEGWEAAGWIDRVQDPALPAGTALWRLSFGGLALVTAAQEARARTGAGTLAAFQAGPWMQGFLAGALCDAHGRCPYPDTQTDTPNAVTKVRTGTWNRPRIIAWTDGLKAGRAWRRRLANDA